MKRKIFSIALALLLIIPTLVGAESKFSDVPETYWASEEIDYLTGKEVIFGYNDGTFRPGDNITRIQAYTMVARALGYEIKEYDDPMATDLKKGTNNYNVLSTAMHYEYAFRPLLDIDFKPYEDIDRYEMAIILVRAFKLERNEWENDFTDVKKTSFRSFPETLAYHGITLGYPDGTFRQDEKVTRVQFSVFMSRAMDEQFRE